jgi:hypothetical protein
MTRKLFDLMALDQDYAAFSDKANKDPAKGVKH